MVNIQEWEISEGKSSPWAANGTEHQSSQELTSSHLLSKCCVCLVRKMSHFVCNFSGFGQLFCFLSEGIFQRIFHTQLLEGNYGFTLRAYPNGLDDFL